MEGLRERRWNRSDRDGDAFLLRLSLIQIKVTWIRIVFAFSCFRGLRPLIWARDKESLVSWYSGSLFNRGRMLRLIRACDLFFVRKHINNQRWRACRLDWLIESDSWDVVCVPQSLAILTACSAVLQWIWIRVRRGIVYLWVLTISSIDFQSRYELKSFNWRQNLTS